MTDLIGKISEKFHLIISSESTIDTVEKAATKAAYAASGMTIFSGFTVNDWGVIVGIVLGVATFGFNVWFKMKYGRGDRK